MTELFEKYRIGALGADEVQAFEQRLENESDFREDYQQYLQQVLGIEGYFLRERLKSHLSQVKKSSDSKRPGVGIWILLSLLTIVIITLTILLLTGKNDKGSPPPTYASLFSPAPGLPTVMGETDNLTFMDGMVDYKKGSYDLSVQKWSTLIDPDLQQDTLLYYLGNAYQALGKSNEALEAYAILIENPGSSFRDGALFRMAILEAERMNYNAAREYLLQTNHPEAQSLLESLAR